MKRVLFVDDEPKILEGLQRMLRSQRRAWDMRFAVGPEAALAELASGSFDVVVTDMRMPGMDGAALLAEVKRLSPATVRIILSGYSNAEASARATHVAHQFLSKPCSAEMLRDAVQRAGALQEGVPSSAVREIVGGMDALPTVPLLFLRISEILSSPQPSLLAIVSLLEQDVGISAKLLQLVNSSFFGIGRRVTTVRGAVDLLGIGIVRGLVLSTEVFRSFRVRQELQGFDADELNAHSIQVATLARRMAQDRQIAEEAHSIGLLHDIGKLVLADRIPARYGEVLRRAAEAGVPLQEVERDELGATHAEVGAYLLGLWNLPETILRAVGEHHSLREIEEPLDAGDLVRIANALVHETEEPPSRRAIQGGGTRSVLEQHGLAASLARWRSLRSTPRGEESGGD